VEESRGLYVLLTGMAFYPLSARVAGRIVELAREQGNTVANGISLTSKLSQNDYAQMAVGSRQRVNKIFRDWEKDGLIEQQGDALLILDLEGLKRQIIPFD
jgi:CRP/FNR family transcriptional regulator, cyclic AMP receptor protein